MIGWRSSCRSAMNMRGISGKWNAMWHSSPSPKYGAHVGRPLVRLGEQHAVRIARVELARGSASGRRASRQVLADRAFALDQVRHRVEPQAVDAAIEPELHHARSPRRAPPGCRSSGRAGDGRTGASSTPWRRVVPGPVRRLGVGEDDPTSLDTSGRCRSRRRSRAPASRPARGAPPGTTGAGRRCG